MPEALSCSQEDMPRQKDVGNSKRKLEHLEFDNQTIRMLPLDKEANNFVRQVVGACFSMVFPQPLENPMLVAVSQDALQLLDLDESEVERPEFLEYFSGNEHLPGTEPAAHCYCGYQFGHFSGQLGDGAAMYLGEVVNQKSERWELQFKGAGSTPYSRAADGRKVLRSSIREFLCSEAMHYLGIPTTRAGTIVTSDSRVERDVHYSGNPIMERCTVITRMAPTFLRFGSFEIFKDTDSVTGRRGPSAGKEAEMLPGMLNFTIRTYFPDIWARHKGEQLVNAEPADADTDASRKRASQTEEMYLDFFCEVVRRTAHLVAQWMGVGWVHGVLNTDNMSVVGLTLDYGPFGFLDTYNPDFISNGSDDGGRYDYKGQPEICRWNCEKFAEAIQHALPLKRSKGLLSVFDDVYKATYISIFRKKLGLVKGEQEGDILLVQELLRTMHTTGADFTNTFRMLARFPMPADDTALAPSNDPNSLSCPDGGVLKDLLSSLASTSELALQYKPNLAMEQLQMLNMLSARDPWLLSALGTSPEMVTREISKAQKMEELQKMSLDAKADADRKAWVSWLRQYWKRLQAELREGATEADRVKVMNSTNPRVVLRNWIAQQAIERAEKGDFSEVQRVLAVLKDPFSDAVFEQEVKQATEEKQAEGPACTLQLRFDVKPPEWAGKLCVTCSS